MSRLSLVICGIGLLSAPAFPISTCANFSGEWEGHCRGDSTGHGHAFTLQQTGCEQLRHTQSNGADMSLDLDGKQHSMHGGTYTAQWESTGKALAMKVTSSVQGVETTMEYDLSELADGTQTATISVLGKSPGDSVEKLLDTCTVKRTK